MDKNYYRLYFDFERKHWWFKVRNNILMDYVDRFKPSGNTKLKILNVGAGTGHTSELLSKIGNVVSVEFDKDCVDFVNKATSLNLIEGSILDLDFPDNNFDIVCAFDVIEHVENDRLAFKEMTRVVKPGGTILISIPAFMSLWSEHDEINHHFRRYTYTKISELSEKIKHIECLYSTYFNSFLFPPIFFYRKLSNLIRRKKSVIHVNKQELKTNFTVANNRLLSAFFYSIFSAERYLLKQGLRFPAGVSLVCIYRKNMNK